jgi:hypothetical protein
MITSASDTTRSSGDEVSATSGQSLASEVADLGKNGASLSAKTVREQTGPSLGAMSGAHLSSGYDNAQSRVYSLLALC